VEGDFRGGEGGFGSDAERETAGFEALGGSVGTADYRRVVAGVDERKLAGGGIEFGEDGGCESLAAEAVGAGVAIEAGGELGEGEAFGGDGA